MEIDFNLESWMRFGPSGTEDVAAKVFVRKLAGHTESVILKCTDDTYYLTTLAHCMSGPYLAANLYLGNALMSTMGLTVPPARRVYLSETFIYSNHELWFDGPFGPCPPSAGFHYGSRYLGDGLPYEERGLAMPVRSFLSPSRFELISNRREFLGALVLDVFANRKEPRQAIFRGEYRMFATFIDHGYTSAYGCDEEETDPAAVLYFDRDIYRGLWSDESVEMWISILGSALRKVLLYHLQFPGEGGYPMRNMIDQSYVLQRLKKMPKLMKPYKKLFSSGTG